MMPSELKGKKVETGICKCASGKGYVAEASYIDPETQKRVRRWKTFPRLDLAQDWRRAIKIDALRGTITRRKKRVVVLFRNFAADDYYRSWSRSVKTSTAKREKKRIDSNLIPHFGDMPIHTITQRDIERYLDQRAEDGVSPATLNRELARIKSIFKKAVEWGVVEKNPASAIKQKKEGVPKADYLTVEEIRKLLDACEDLIRPIITMAVYTGMRFGEIVGLKWVDVDFRREQVALTDTKNHETRNVPLHPVVSEMLGDMRRKQAIASGGIQQLVFPNPRTGRPFKDIRKSFKAALIKAGITRPFRFHDLRHTAASHLAMNEVDLGTIGKILGHRSPLMTRRYAHLSPGFLRDSVSRLNFEDTGLSSQENA